MKPMTTRPGRPSRGRIAGEIALTTAAVAGLACIVAAIATIAFGFTPLMFRSASMEPTIPTGALAFAQDTSATELNIGDIISVDNQQGVRVTHRIVSIDSTAGDAAQLTLQGDANPDPDTQSYVINDAPRVLFHIDGLGYVLSWLRTPAALMLGAVIVGALLWLIVWPGGRRGETDRGRERPPLPQHTRAHRLTPLLVLASTTVMLIGLGNIPGTAAAFTDTAAATTGSFASRAAFTPKVASPVGCAGNNDASRNGDPVTLTWKHLGAPYQYRIILRDAETGSGLVWRTWDVTNVTVATGANVSFNIDGVGFERHGSIWRYNAEVHTMLPGGAVSSQWSGYTVSTPTVPNQYMDLNCAVGGPQDGTAAYVPPPDSITCTSMPAVGGTAAYARIQWPHLGSPYNYNATTRATATGNALLGTNVTGTAGTVTYDVRSSALATGDRSAGAARVEIRTLNGTDASTGFVAYGITISNGIQCAAAAQSSQRGASPQNSTTTSTAPPTTSTFATSPTTAPSTTTQTGAPTTATPTTTPGTTAVPVPPEPPPTPTDVPLSSPVNSPSDNYSAQLVRGESGSSAVIRTMPGTEVYRTPADSGASLSWAANSDELLIDDSSGSWSVTRSSDSWVKAPVVEKAPLPATVEPPPTQSPTAPSTMPEIQPSG